MIVSLNFNEEFESRQSRDLVMILALMIDFFFCNCKIRIDQDQRVIDLHVNDLHICMRMIRKRIIVLQTDLKNRRCIDFHVCMKKTKIVNRLNHVKLINMMNMICDESMIVNLENII
jgi:hypothetical protein